jgi:fructokinase
VRATASQRIAANIETPQVFFVDRLSRATIDLARTFRERGSIVFFEPSGVSDPRMFKEM